MSCLLTDLYSVILRCMSKPQYNYISTLPHPYTPTPHTLPHHSIINQSHFKISSISTIQTLCYMRRQYSRIFNSLTRKLPAQKLCHKAFVPHNALGTLGLLCQTLLYTAVYLFIQAKAEIQNKRKIITWLDCYFGIVFSLCKTKSPFFKGK